MEGKKGSDGKQRRQPLTAVQKKKAVGSGAVATAIILILVATVIGLGCWMVVETIKAVAEGIVTGIVDGIGS